MIFPWRTREGWRLSTDPFVTFANVKPLGGLIVLICGDFQQILPVVKKRYSSRRTQGICKIKVSTMTLKRNMRLHITGNPEWGRWSAKLLRLGLGNIPTNASEEIDLTTLGVNIFNSTQELQSKIYPNLEENYNKSDWLWDRIILALRNDIVEQTNPSLMAKMPGVSVVYRYDQTTEVSKASSYPIEVLDSQNPPGLPPQELHSRRDVPLSCS